MCIPKTISLPTVICENEELSYDGDASCWETASATLLWKDSRTPIEVTAANFLKPTDSSVDYMAIDISSDQNTGVSDLLYFKGTVDPTLITDVTEEGMTKYALVDGKIRLPMSHILSKITINLSLNNEFSLDGEVGRSTTNPVSDMVIGSTHICDHFNLTTGLFLGDFKDSNDSPSVVSDIKMLPCSYAPATTRDETASATYEATIIPQTLSANTFKVNFRLDGKTYLWTYPSEITFLSGNHYSLNLSVGKYALEITGVDFGNGGGADIVEL